MPNDISRSREGQDQKSDQPQTRDVSHSKGKPFNVIRQEATLNDSQRRGVSGQADELERLRKGKMLASTDGKDEKSTTGGDSHPTEKIILSNRPTRDKPGLLGGGNAPGTLGAELERQILESRKREKAERYRKELQQDLSKLQNDYTDRIAKLNQLTVNDWQEMTKEIIEKYPFFGEDEYCKEFLQDYKERVASFSKNDIEQVKGIDPNLWHYMKKQNRWGGIVSTFDECSDVALKLYKENVKRVMELSASVLNSDQRASTSRG